MSKKKIDIDELFWTAVIALVLYAIAVLLD